MLYSIVVGILAYYLLLAIIGVLVNTMAIEGTLIAFAAFCFIGAYLARSSRFVRRMALWIGGICTGILISCWCLLPILQGSGNMWVYILSIILGIVCYIASRRYWHRRFLRRDQHGNRPQPPFGREWVRWLLAFIA